MTPPFEPGREDGRSLRQVAFDYVTCRTAAGTLAPGDVIKHADLAAEMEVTYPSSTYFQAVTQAITMLQAAQHRSLVSVRGEGYRLIEGMAMVDKGRGEHRRGRRQMGKAVATVGSVDEDSLVDSGQRTLLRQVHRGFQIIASVIDQQAEKIAEHEQEITDLKGARLDDRARLRTTEEEIADMKARLEAVERQRDAG